jgi:hypothetical protein
MQNETRSTNAERYWTVEELLEGVEESLAWERNGYRFTVYSDDVCYPVMDKRGLRKIVDCTYAKRPRVFRNADKGITIDFDAK